MIISRIVETTLSTKTISYYEDLGYIIPLKKDGNGNYIFKKGIKMWVKLEDLKENSNAFVEYICDYCYGKNQIDEKSNWRRYVSIMTGRKLINKDCCTNKGCTEMKKKERHLFVYGVEHPTKLESTQEKMRQTNIRIHGVPYPSQNNEILNKMKQTNIIRFGTEHVSQNKEIKNKIAQTNIEKYGISCSLLNKEVKRKAMKTLFTNESAPSSRQQKYLHKILGGKLNFPIDNFYLDIAFTDEKIYVEYDGGGHWLTVAKGSESLEQFEDREKNRSSLLEKYGWKEIRIISRKDKLPTLKVIYSIMEYAKTYLNKGNQWIILDLDNFKVKTMDFEKEYNFGQLRYLSKKDIESLDNAKLALSF